MKFPNPDLAYPGKLLLFGEYTVLSGSRALAMPMTRWQGRLRSGVSQDVHLQGLSSYLAGHGLFDKRARRALQAAVEDGLTFDSNIPQGYGVGSSGALSAAVYEQFLATDDELKEIARARASMASLESYFHGRSSGMDPLVSLVRVPILKESDTYLPVAPLTWPEGLRVFLIDTDTQRRTESLVQSYRELSAGEDFQLKCLRPLIQSVDHAISFILDGHISALWDHLQIISQLQFQYFNRMIPPPIVDIWSKIAGQNDICIKLCGAGGGGFFLGFAISEKAFIAFQRTCPLKIIAIN